MVSQEIGKSENTVSRWCSNKAQPSIQQLLNITDLLEVDVRNHIKSKL